MTDAVKLLWTIKYMSLCSAVSMVLAMSSSSIPALVQQESFILKWDFLFSVNLPDIHAKQRSVSESTALNFDYLQIHLITSVLLCYCRETLCL